MTGYTGFAPATLAETVDTHNGLNEELPLVHTMLWSGLFRLLREPRLSPELCDVFQEHLVYLFYGRPAYRSSRPNPSQPTTDIAFCPVCFVFKPYTLVTPIRRVYPFDTGAACEGLFEPHIAQANWQNYGLSSVIESARRYTHMFFRTNRNYYLASPRVPPPTGGPGVSTLHALLTWNGVAGYDDRRSAVEVQVASPIALRDALLAVILPGAFLGQDDIRRAVFEEWRTYPITYPTYRGASPSEYYGVIRDRLERFLSEGSYL